MSGNFTCSDSLLTECMPQLTSLFPTSVHYDCSVPMEMFSDPVTTESTFHSADSIETIARSLSRNIHSSEVIDSRRVRGDSFSALGLDESDSVFSSGIAADDMCSLLEQFEEASQSIDSDLAFDLDFPKSVSEPPTRVTSPVVDHSSQLHDLEVVKLLKAKNPLQTRTQPQVPGPVPSNSPPRTGAAKQKKPVSPVFRPTSCTPQTSASPPRGAVRVSANYFREIRDHDYCSNVPQKGPRVTTPAHIASSKIIIKEEEVNPEGSMLKSLLINSELMEKMKQETLERRTSSSSSKSLEDLTPIPDSEVIISGESETFVNGDEDGVVQNQNSSSIEINGKDAVDFEQLIDADMSKSQEKKMPKMGAQQPVMINESNSEKPTVSIVTVSKTTNSAVNATAMNTQKKTFTLDELIAKDMKRKAIEKAQLQAILKTTPRSNPNTPKSSPYQSPRKSDSPKLPELPELNLNNMLNGQQNPVKSVRKGLFPKISPAKKSVSQIANSVAPKVSLIKQEITSQDAEKFEDAKPLPRVPLVKQEVQESSPVEQETASQNAEKPEEVKPVPRVPKPEEVPSRQRTESKCLDVVDMEVDNSDAEVPATENLSTDVVQPNVAYDIVVQPNVAYDIVTKATELVKVIVNTIVDVPTVAAADITAESEVYQDDVTKIKDEPAVENEIQNDYTGSNNAPLEWQNPSNEVAEISEADVDKVETSLDEEVEENLYETAMDIEVHPEDDDINDCDSDGYDFELPKDKELCDITTDLNDNTPLQPDMTSVVGPAGKVPLIKDPLGLESSGVVNVFQEETYESDNSKDVVKFSDMGIKTSKRNYRRHDVGDRVSPPVFDKLPGYCKLLTVPTKYPQKGEVKASKFVDNSIPDRDRDPSPDRSDPMYNKVPTYVTHFTNSTKYDGSYEKTGSQNSSRSQTPSLVIASSRGGSISRPTSRPVSRESTPPRAYKDVRSSSSSSNCSACSSSSSDYDSSRSRSRSHRRSSRGSRNSRHRHDRRKSYSSRSRGSRRSSRRTRSRSRSPIRRHRRRSSRSSSRSSSSAYSRSRSRSRSRVRDRRRRGDRRRKERAYHSRRSVSLDRRWREREEVKEKRKEKQIEERRIIYVGKISPQCTRRDLRIQFEQFGEIEDTSVHLRESGGDHYGFVTFCYTCDAFAAIENGNKYRGLENYDLCFGGRRQFCKESYADLDGNAEEEEEMAPVMPKRGGDLDFDALLRQTQKLIKKKKSSS